MEGGSEKVTYYPELGPQWNSGPTIGTQLTLGVSILKIQAGETSSCQWDLTDPRGQAQSCEMPSCPPPPPYFPAGWGPDVSRQSHRTSLGPPHITGTLERGEPLPQSCSQLWGQVWNPIVLILGPLHAHVKKRFGPISLWASGQVWLGSPKSLLFSPQHFLGGTSLRQDWAGPRCHFFSSWLAFPLWSLGSTCQLVPYSWNSSFVILTLDSTESKGDLWWMTSPHQAVEAEHRHNWFGVMRGTCLT